MCIEIYPNDEETAAIISSKETTVPQPAKKVRFGKEGTLPVHPALRTPETILEDVKQLCLTLHSCISTHSIPTDRLEAMEEILKSCVADVKEKGQKKLSQLQVVRVIKRKGHDTNDYSASQVEEGKSSAPKRIRISGNSLKSGDRSPAEASSAADNHARDDGNRLVSINTIRK